MLASNQPPCNLVEKGQQIMNAPIHPLITLEHVYAAANYNPLPVVLSRGEGDDVL